MKDRHKVLRRIVAIILPVVLAGGIVSASAPRAFADTTCSGTGCNGLDPVQTGCGNLYAGPWDDKQRVSNLMTMHDLNTGAEVGRVWLDYSAACGTNWIEGWFEDGNPDDGSYVVAEVQGTYGNSGLYGYGPVDFYYYGTGHNIWGNMIYSPGCAKGLIDRHNNDYSIHIGGEAVQVGCP
jgi:hypothetical protein